MRAARAGACRVAGTLQDLGPQDVVDVDHAGGSPRLVGDDEAGHDAFHEGEGAGGEIVGADTLRIGGHAVARAPVEERPVGELLPSEVTPTSRPAPSTTVVMPNRLALISSMTSFMVAISVITGTVSPTCMRSRTRNSDCQPSAPRGWSAA